MRRQSDFRTELMSRLALLLVAAGFLTMVPGPFSWSLAEAEPLATLRGAEIDEEPAPPTLGEVENKDLRRARNYPEQPPTVPHKVRDYQVDLYANKCMTCHSRTAVGESQAPMISVTHYTDRQGQVRAFMSPRRYFCSQCHVPQQDVRAATGNSFVDVDKLITGLGKEE